MKISAHSLVLTALLLGAALLSGCSATLVGTGNTTPTATTTTLTSSSTSISAGSSVTLTATVSPSAATGTVTFLDGTKTLGTGTLSSGVATLSVATLGVGTHSITAAYGGAGSTYAASTSTAVSVIVSAVTTSTALTASATSATVGSAVTFTATVSPAGATGTVTFYDGATALGTGTLSGGVATFSTSSLAVGAHNVTAVYGGAIGYGASTSGVRTVTIATIATTTALTASGTTTTTGISVTLTAMVSPSAATGTVTFFDGATRIGVGTLASGVATVSVSNLSIGSHSMTAVYAGAGSYAGSTSNVVVLTGTAIATTTTLTSSATTALAGTAVNFTATVSPSVATGTVTFYDGTASLGTGTLVSGVATFSISTLAAGAHSITAVYAGDATYATSTSAAVAVTVNLVTTSLTLVSNATVATAGTNVVFTATMSPSTAPGTVTFKDGATTIGTSTLSFGMTTVTTSTLKAGVHFITASFPASAVYAGSTSNGVAVTVNAASTTPVTGTYSGPSITGKVMAGALPVVGASVQFYAAGTTGYGVAAGPLMASAITTDASGSFTIPSGYSCPLPATQAYLVATGGTTSTVASAPFEFLSALGACSAVPTTVVVNEVTTAAAVWPLRQFLGQGGSIGTTGTNAKGLANAFLIAGSLASTTTGTSPGASFPSTATATSPAPKVNALANLMNTCGLSNAGCQQFFTAAGGAANTLDAALAVVQNPAGNPVTLYTLSRNSTAYTPALSAAPADWTLFTVLSGSGLSNGASTLGVMSTGNVWVANFFGSATQFTPLGAPAFAPVTGYGLNSVYGLAVDPYDNAWLPNNVSAGSVTKISADGTAASNIGGQGMMFPVATASDTDGSVWVADIGNATLTHMSNTGAPLSGSSGYQSGSTAFPTALAIDANHNVWTASQNDVTVTRINPDGTNPIVVSCCKSPSALAIDQRGVLWVGDYYGSGLAEVSSTGTLIAKGLTGGGIVSPQGVAVDGVGNVWVANFHAVGISELSGSQSPTPGTPLSPSNGFGADGPSAGGYSIAIDASGNVWMANFNTSNVVRYLGLAAPTKTPVIGPAQAP